MTDETYARDLAALRRKWLDRWPFGLYIAWRERRLAISTSLSSLRVYRELEVAYPDASAVERYEQVVIRHTGLDRDGARDLVQRAENSFAVWSNERPLQFCDVVQYLVFHECLKADPSALGARAQLSSFIADVIPADM